MSFSFGASTGTPAGGAGFSFGNAATKTQTTTAQASFTLGQSATQTSGQPAGGFSFGASLGQTPKATGISFGTPNVDSRFNTPTPQATANTVPPTQVAQSTQGLSLGTPGNTGGSLLGAALGSSTAPKSLFGASTATQGTASPASGSFSLGGATTAQPASGFSLGGSLAAQTTAQTLGGATTPAPGFTLGGATRPQPSGLPLGGSTAPQTLGGSPAPGGFTLGGTTTQPSGLNLGGSTAAPSSTTAPTTGGPTLGSSTGFGLGTLGLKTTAPTPAAQTGTTGGFQLGGGTTSQAQPLAQTLGTAKTTATVIAQPSTSVVPGASLSTATSTTASTLPQSSMNYRQLEEAINKWTLELEEQEKIFLEQATQVNAWDRLLIDNGDKITQLNTNVEQVKFDQQRLDQELDFILSQQKELEELVIPLEQAVESLPPLAYQQHADIEREHTYKLAENIDAQLKTMSRDLKEIIEHLNTSNTNKDSTDPIIQISKILNAHMDSLTWVDQNAALLQRKVQDVSRQVDVQKKQQDRSFRHGYD